MARNAAPILLLLALLVAADAGVLVHAREHRRLARDTREARGVVRVVGAADLALSTNARWLRHPSSVETWAAVSDLPASLDTEPAGGVIGPPVPRR